MELLERAPFLDSLSGYAAEARSGNGRLVLVAGEAGIGKTALLEAFQRREPEARWLWGACDGLFTPRPLGPLFDIAAEVGGDLEELGRRPRERGELFTAFLRTIDAPPGLTGVVIEDIHWADEATLDLLRFLGRRLARAHALLVATYRDDELEEDHPLRTVLGDLATQRTTRRIWLPPLSEDAVRALAADGEVEPTELYRLTGGNPFFVTEVLEATPGSVPSTVRDAVIARVARLTPRARRALKAAGVIGNRVEPRLLEAVIGETSPAVDECISSGTLISEGRVFRFRHELARLAVEGLIPAHQHSRMNASVLEALEQSPDADPARLSHHAEGAGDAAAVLRYAPKAAQKAAELGSHSEAVAQYRRALRFEKHLGEAERASLYEDLAYQCSFLDLWEEAVGARRAALGLRRELDDPIKVGENLRWLSRAFWRLCRGAEAEEAVIDAVRVLEPLPPGRELAWAYADLAARLMTASRSVESISAADDAITLAEQLDEPEILSSALNTKGSAMLCAGQDGWDQVDRALEIALAAGLEEHAGRAYANLYSFGVDHRQFGRVERYFVDGDAYCRDHEITTFALCLRGAKARALVHLGLWDEAASLSAQALAHPSISPVNRINPLLAMACVSTRRGEGEAWLLLDEALELAEGSTELQWIGPARIARAEARWLGGDPQRATAEARAGYKLALQHFDAWLTGELAVWLWRCGALEQAPKGVAKQYAQQIAGDWRGAADLWEGLGCSYEAAMAMSDSWEEAALRNALDTFVRLGAEPAAALLRRKMRKLGMKAIPRGHRPTTRSAPLKLTPREQEVLALLSEGLPNSEISSRLFISEKTVNHHVSSVLAKVGVKSRVQAAQEAVRLGIVAAS